MKTKNNENDTRTLLEELFLDEAISLKEYVKRIKALKKPLTKTSK